MAEEWRPTQHSTYDVSSLGRIRSHARRGWRTNSHPQIAGEPRIRKTNRDRNGYWGVTLGRGGKRCLIHRLVAAAFIGPCPVGQEVRHKDDNPANNRANNLEYGTSAQNSLDMMRRKRRAYKLTPEDIPVIRQGLSNGLSHRVIAETFSVSASAIRNVAIGRTWGYV